jgi:DNA-binding GntR family transcriptional regulator
MTRHAYPCHVAQREGRTPHRYRQIADDLRRRIEAGEYPVGTQLPTKTELAAQHGAAVGTVDDALGVLRKLNLVETRHGAGTFVLRERPGKSEEEELGEQVAQLRADLAEMTTRVDAMQDSSLREIVSRIEANLIDLYGKTGFDYPEDGDNGQEWRNGEVQHG